MNGIGVQWIRWVLIPLGVFGGAELLARRTFSDTSLDWYDVTLKEPSSLQGQFLFVGSSISACAINDLTFQRTLSRRGLEATVRNRAMGGATLPLHVIALRSLLEENPEALRGTEVILELPGGLPFHYHPDELASNRDYLLASNRVHQLYLSVATPSEFGELWKDQLALETKLSFSLRLGTRAIALSRWRERVRQEVLDRWLAWVKGELNRMGVDPDEREKPIGALIERGGIRNDAAFAERIQGLVRRFAAEDRFQVPYPEWEESQVAELVELVQTHGGRICGYDPPLHSTYASLLQGENTQSARDGLRRYLESKGVPVLTTGYEAKDAFFPDAFHLHKIRAPKFSQGLAEAWWQEFRAE